MAVDDLLRELGGLEAACRGEGATKEPSGADAPFCLCRIVNELSTEAWRQLKHELELDAWHVTTPEVLDSGTSLGQLRRFLLCEMDRARQCHLPLALAFIRPDSSEAADSVFDLVRAQVRSFDHASRQEDGSISVVLSATPLAAAERLMGAMLRRIRQISEPTLTCSAGLIGYGGLAQLTAEALIERADKALEDARRLGGNRLEVAPCADAALASRETLVRASEKHFLFTGKKPPEQQDQE
jgi:hypothetical protein